MPKMRKSKQKSRPKLSPVEMTIQEVSRGGAGMGRDLDGRAIFVPFTAPGDVVKVRLKNSKQRYAEADLLELIEASDQRQDPPCPVFTQCGGCQWQHLPYSLQWNIKREGLTESLRRAKVSTKLKWDEYPAKTIWHYRNRIQLRKKGTQLGFYSRQSHQIVPISQCAIACTEINAAISEILTNTANKDSQVKENGKFELSLSLTGQVQQFSPDQHQNQQTSHGFRQVNDEQNVNLLSWIKQSISTFHGILDLYGGSGNLSLALANSVSQIHCVDLNICKGNEPYPDNIIFHQSAVRTWLECRVEETKYTRKTSTEQPTWLALLDPPRDGLHKDGDVIIQCLQKLGVSSVILVGCKTDPWSRDVAKFISQGWTLDKVAVFDFFPQTFHVESAALLSRNP